MIAAQKRKNRAPQMRESLEREVNASGQLMDTVNVLEKAEDRNVEMQIKRD